MAEHSRAAVEALQSAAFAFQASGSTSHRNRVPSLLKLTRTKCLHTRTAKSLVLTLISGVRAFFGIEDNDFVGELARAVVEALKIVLLRFKLKNRRRIKTVSPVC